MIHTTRSVPPAVKTALALVALLAALAATTSSASAASWLPHSLNFPSGISQERLFGVSCSSSTTCLAVGDDYNGGWGVHAEAGWGSGWAFQSTLTRISGHLYGASCPSTTWCLAGGFKDTSGGPEAMAQVRNGSTWTYHNVGVPAGATKSSLNAVSCRSSSWCMGVGWKTAPTDSKPFTASFNGATWTHTTTATASNATLLGVSCTSTTSCVAVGASAGSALAQVWDGASWTPTPTVAVPPGGSNYVLNSISCVSALWCLAVGTYHSPSGDRAIASLWDGSTWTSKPNLPWGSGGGAAAYGVSCISTTVCHAVGQTAATLPLAAAWNGTTWALETTPLAPGATNAVLRGVSCFSATRCEASGWSLFGGTPTGLIETFS